MKLRRLVWLLVPPLIGVAVYAARSGDLSRRWAIFIGSDPVLECPATVELGEQELGKVTVARFTVANRGGGELVLDEIRTNCACSGLEREKDGQFFRIESLRLGPNQQAELAMRILVQGPPGGAARNSVAFHSNDATRPQAAIEVFVSKVRAGVTTLPTSVGFGTMPIGGEARQVLDIFDGAVKPRVVERVVSTCPERVAVRLLPADGTLPESKDGSPGALIGRVEVTARGQEPGLFDGRVAIHLVGEDHPPTLIPVTGRIAAAVEVLPSLLVLPRASDAGPVYFGQCLCRSTEGKPLALTIDSTPEGFSVQVEAVENVPSQQIIRIDWKGAKEADLLQGARGTVRLRASVGGQETPLEILVRYQRNGGP